jgi:hypothetical protein
MGTPSVSILLMCRRRQYPHRPFAYSLPTLIASWVRRARGGGSNSVPSVEIVQSVSERPRLAPLKVRRNVIG